MSRKVVVTGSEGYIGSVLCALLKQSGYETIEVDRKAPYDSCGMRERGFLKKIRQAVWDDELVAIVHLAADSLLGPSVKNPLPYFVNNVGQSTEFLQELMTIPLGDVPFIFASSAAVYGDPSVPGQFSVNITEGDPKKPINPYGRSKLQFEEILEECSRAYGLRAPAFRFFNVVGALPLGAGEWKGQPTDQPHILTSLCRAVYEEKPFVLAGSNYDTYDGTPIRDYIHVLDVCEAIIAEFAPQAWRKGFQAYNLCTGHGTTNLEIAKKFQELVAPDLKIEYGPRRAGDPAFLVGNSSKYQMVDKWSPQYSRMDTIINSAFMNYVYARSKEN